MREVLSQNEIDNLLNAINEGKIDTESISLEREHEIKKYDFRRPNKFSKEQLRILYMIHENFSRMASNFLSAYLRSNVQVKITSVDQLNYEDLLVSITSPTLMTGFSLNPLEGTALMECNYFFVYPIIDLLLGGTGAVINSTRELTDIEMRVMKKLNTKLLDIWANALSEMVALTPSIEGVETNPQFSQLISPNETIALVTFKTIVNKAEGLINLCLPFISLEPVITKLAAHYWFAHQNKYDRDKEARVLGGILNDVILNLRVVYGETTISVQDFLELQIGDVLLLDKTIGSNLKVMVENKVKFKAQPGSSKSKIAVQIVDYIKGDRNI